MKTLSDILHEILLAVLVLIFAAAVAFPKSEPVKPETDPPFFCTTVPCVMPPEKLDKNGLILVSEKYKSKWMMRKRSR